MGKKGKKGKLTGTLEVVRLKTESPGKEQYAAMLAIGGCKAQNLAGEYEVLPEARSAQMARVLVGFVALVRLLICLGPAYIM